MPSPASPNSLLDNGLNTLHPMSVPKAIEKIAAMQPLTMGSALLPRVTASPRDSKLTALGASA